jgi:hypothetical protein
MEVVIIKEFEAIQRLFLRDPFWFCRLDRPVISRQIWLLVSGSVLAGSIVVQTKRNYGQKLDRILVAAC